MKKLFIVTGELSGDKHAACIVNHLLKTQPELQIEAIGGDNLKNLGVKLWVDHTKGKMSAVGLNPKMILEHMTLGKRVVDYITKDFKPDAVLLVDYGGFNLGISKFIKKAGIKTFYYIPPQIWASRKWRIKSVKKNIDKVLTIFPFEKEMYEKEGIDAQFVGHPIVAQLPGPADKAAVYEKYGLDKNKKLISIFPGSRVFELHHLMKTFLKSAELIAQNYDDVQFVIAQAQNIKDETLKSFMGDSEIQVVKDDNYSLLSVSDALMLASGTVALEAALYKTPMIVSYRGPAVAYFVYTLVRCIKRVCLPNIIMDKDIVPELIQADSTPERVSKELLRILKDENYRTAMIEDLSRVKNLLSEYESGKEAAKIISASI